MPRIARACSPWWSESEPIRRAHVHDAPGDEQRGEPLQQPPRSLDVLDGLEEDDRVPRGAVLELLDQRARERKPRARVLGRGVLVRLRVGVNPDDLGGAAGENSRAVALTAGHVGDPRSRAMLPDPAIDR